MPRSRLRALGCGLLLTLGATAVALVLGEIGVRLFVPQPLLRDPDAFVPDPRLGARLKPGFDDRVVTTEFSSTWTINEDGHRGPRAGPKDQRYRIVALGDSFTFGYGVEAEEAWPARLQALLSEKGGAGVEVINLGVGGYGTFEEARSLEDERGRLSPDLAIIAFYVGNDPFDNRRWYPPVPITVPGEAPIPAAMPDATERLKRWLGGRLQLYNMLSTRGDELLVRSGLRRLTYPFEIDVLREPPPASVAAAWDATHAAFRLLTHLQESGLAIRVVLIPMKHQVDDVFWQRLLEQYDRLGGPGSLRALDRDRPQRIVDDLLLDARLDAFDLLPGLRQEARGASEPLYWARDQHWTAAGHAAAARLIAARLRIEELVP